MVGNIILPVIDPHWINGFGITRLLFQKSEVTQRNRKRISSCHKTVVSVIQAALLISKDVQSKTKFCIFVGRPVCFSRCSCSPDKFEFIVHHNYIRPTFCDAECLLDCYCLDVFVSHSVSGVSGFYNLVYPLHVYTTCNVRHESA
jgi:hypothetical protein